MKDDKRNRVRIIGGEWRSRVLRFPDGASLRPTPDRVRETLFNWLGQTLDGLRCLDLFAGSGALGFEALSRGAADVTMVEADAKIAQVLRDNAKLLGAERLRVLRADALEFLRGGQEAYDVVFLDPPYSSGLGDKALAVLPPRLSAGARVYTESDRPIEAGGRWQTLKSDRAGAVHYYLLQHEGE